ncbi:MAG: hypothetical protein IKI26_07185 [Prevotella sp.]|nr:hypothetical protein [Prevotella sp.]
MRIPGWPKGEASRKVLYLLVTITVVVFALFYLVGYNHPWAEDPDFIEPRLTSVLMVFAILVLLMAVLVTAWAVVRTMRRRRNAKADSHGVPAALIAMGVTVFTALTLGVSFLMGASSAITVNGEEYHEEGWLKAANMFVLSSIILIVVATAVVAIATIRTYLNNRK